jgi:hypothetical protein
MAGTIKVDSINADSNLALKIANTAVAFIDATGLRPVAGNLNLDATATSKFYLPSANTVAIQTAGVTAVTVDSSQNVTLAGTLTTTGITNSGVATATRFNPTGSSATGNGMYLPAANSLGLSTNGTNAVYIDSSQNVGIGTSSPSNKLDVFNSTFGGSNTSFILSSVNSASAKINFSGIGYTVDQGSAGIEAGSMYFSTYGSGALTERMRIDSSGNLLVGTTTNYGTARTSINNSGTVLGLYCSGASGTTAMVIGKQSNDASTSQVLMQFLYNNGSSGLGQINGNGGSSAAFGSYSDIRLKENITDLPSQLANIMALRPVEFDWKDGTGHQIGFIAQEVNEVYPDVVGENADGMLTLTDMNKNDARLIKAVQEMKAIIDTQASTITALTARITALTARIVALETI